MLLARIYYFKNKHERSLKLVLEALGSHASLGCQRDTETRNKLIQIIANNYFLLERFEDAVCFFETLPADILTPENVYTAIESYVGVGRLGDATRLLKKSVATEGQTFTEVVSCF